MRRVKSVTFVTFEYNSYRNSVRFLKKELSNCTAIDHQ